MPLYSSLSTLRFACAGVIGTQAACLYKSPRAVVSAGGVVRICKGDPDKHHFSLTCLLGYRSPHAGNAGLSPIRTRNEAEIIALTRCLKGGSL